MFWYCVVCEFFDVGFEYWVVYVGRVGVADDALGIWWWMWDGDDVDVVVECVVYLWGVFEGGEDEGGERN